MSYVLLQGSASSLPLRDESVQTCVTSPPYWGLRQYAGEQREVWGGHSINNCWRCQDYGSCGHVHEWGADVRTPWANSVPGPNGAVKNRVDGSQEKAKWTGPFCACGAWYGALGLEPTPELYVEHIVAVFREVKRVLRRDGTLWLNLGSSYAGGGNGGGGSFATERPGWNVFGGNDPNQSRRDSRAPAYGSDGTGRSGSSESDSACLDLCDECRAVLSPGTARNDQPTHGSPSPSSRRARGSEPLDSAPASPAVSPRASRASMRPESSQRPPGECSHCGNCGACLDVLRSAARDSRLCARTAAYKSGTSPLVSASRIEGKDAVGMAWLNYTYKPKDLVPIPWMVAMALQRDGWYLRCDIVWSKPNPMPESVTDRPTKSHEYIFLLSKSPSYYYDADAIREPAIYAGTVVKASDPATAKNAQKGQYGATALGFTQHDTVVSDGRNRRTVWNIATAPYPGAHFATYPPALIEPCILAGSSAQACGVCGAPWERMTVQERPDVYRGKGVRHGNDGNGMRMPDKFNVSTRTTGWQPTCAHEDGSGSSVVLDLFNGSGTTGAVALRLGRSYVGVDISREYLSEQALHRVDPLAGAAHDVRTTGLGQGVMAP